MQFGIVLDSIFTRHFTPEGHPEQPERIEAIHFRDYITEPSELKKMMLAYRLGKWVHRGEYRGDGVTYYFGLNWNGGELNPFNGDISEYQIFAQVQSWHNSNFIKRLSPSHLLYHNLIYI